MGREEGYPPNRVALNWNNIITGALRKKQKDDKISTFSCNWEFVPYREDDIISYLQFSTTKMEFRKKKEILEYLGKDVKDVRLIDRMIKRGEIKKEGCVYIYESREVELEKEIKILKEKLDSMLRDDKISSKESMVDKNINLSDLEKQIESLNSDLDFQIAENEKLEKKVATFQECIRRCYLRAQNVKKDKTPWPVFKKEVLKLEENISGEDNQ